MAHTAALPLITAESGLTRYLEEIRRFPMLEPQEEYMLAKSWREHGDREAAHRLVTSHLRLVAKIAMGYRGYGLPISEVISEGNVGLMQAVKRFEPDKGFRLATYAMWWIKAAIQEYILRSWSLVKMGTTANQKKLFFNLRKAKSWISALEEGDLRPDQVKLIAKRLGVTEQDVVDMNRRLGGDVSLNHRISLDLDLGVGNRQRRNGDQSAAREVIAEYFPADLGEAIAVTHVGDEYGHLHHVAELTARLLQRAIQVLEKLPHLAVKVARQRFAVVVQRGGLSGKPHRSAAFSDHRLRIAALLWTVAFEVLLRFRRSRQTDQNDQTGTDKIQQVYSRAHLLLLPACGRSLGSTTMPIR